MLAWLRNALEGLADFVRPVEPRFWGAAARQLAAGPGWQPPMLLIAALATVLFSHRLLGPFAVIHGLHMAAGGIISLLAMVLVARRALVVFPRYGIWGFTRPRWWFELGRTLWTVCVVAIAMVFGLGIAGMWRAGPGIDTVFDFLIYLGGYAFAGFCFASVVAYLLSFVLRLPRHGKAHECVEFFFGIILANAIVVCGVMGFQNAKVENAVVAALGIAASAVAVAAVVAILKRRRKRDGSIR